MQHTLDSRAGSTRFFQGGLSIVTFEELEKTYPTVQDPLYGHCVVVPAADVSEFPAYWEDQLKKQGCKIFQGSADRRAVFFVRSPGQGQNQEAPEPRTVYTPPQKPPGRAVKGQPFLGKPWTQEEDKELIKAVTLGQNNKEIAERLPGRTPIAVGLRINRLRKHGALPKTKRGQRRKPIRRPPLELSGARGSPISELEKPVPMRAPVTPPMTTGKAPFEIKTTLQVNINVDCSDGMAVDRFLQIAKHLGNLTQKEGQSVRAA